MTVYTVIELRRSELFVVKEDADESCQVGVFLLLAFSKKSKFEQNCTKKLFCPIFGPFFRFTPFCPIWTKFCPKKKGMPPWGFP